MGWGIGHASAQSAGSVVFLFLGELFLIPHLLPIALALARSPACPRITLLVITSIHEEIVAETIARLGLTDIAIRRARLYRRYPPGTRATPHLPHKLLILLVNAWTILRHDVAVVAERTSLWLPRIARRRGASFVYNEHGAGPHANFSSPRNRFAARILMPGEGMAACVRAGGHADAPIATVGYMKHDFLREMAVAPRHAFPQARPIVVYVPHWLAGKSSWWAMGEQVLEFFAASPDYNLVLAPHMRLPCVDKTFAARIARFRGVPNIHIDTDSFALVDQRYTNHADLYLGDGSSQVLEFAERPRPVLFLNPERIDWRRDARFSHWAMGEVVEDVAALGPALAAAPAAHPAFAPIQRAYVTRMMGADDGRAGDRAAGVVREVLAERRHRPLRATGTALARLAHALHLG